MASLPPRRSRWCPRSIWQTESRDEELDVIAAFTDSRQRRSPSSRWRSRTPANGRRPSNSPGRLMREPRVFAWRAIAEAQAKAGLTTQSIASFDRAVQAALSFNPHDKLLAV